MRLGKMDTMTSHTSESPSIAEICESVKNLGYGTNQRIRLYGEEFEVISDPFPDAEGIAVHVKTERDTVRTVRLPETVLQSVKGRTSKKAA
jgi:hypothetical protein